MQFRTPSFVWVTSSIQILYLKGEDFFGFFPFFMYDFQHCFICRPQIPLCRRMLGSNPRQLRLYGMAVRRSNHSARSHPNIKYLNINRERWVIQPFFAQRTTGWATSEKGNSNNERMNVSDPEEKIEWGAESEPWKMSECPALNCYQIIV